MNSFTRFKLLLVLGAFVFGGLIGAITSATGYAAYAAQLRNFWSPTTLGFCGFLGGVILSLRISLDHPWSTGVRVAFGAACAVALGTLSYFFRAYNLGPMLAALPTAEYALIIATFMAAVTAIACTCVKDK